MDDFVCNKLTEWSLGELTQTFKDHDVDKESLYCLEDRDIDALIPKVGPRSKFRKRLKLLKEEQSTTDPETSDSSVEDQQSTTDPETSDSSVEVCPSTSNTNDKEKEILSDVKYTMSRVLGELPDKDDKLIKILKKNIKDLETEKRELVGIFGKTGAGKSSLINAVIGVEGLLPCGSIRACTSVMIKVEANMKNPKYEAEIEFITKEDWEEEFNHFHGDNDDNEKGEDYQDSVEKFSLLYGEEWENISPEKLMDEKHFEEIPEFLSSKSKTLTSDTAEDLSRELVKYTRSKSNEEDAKWYWPLVKCVTVRVPDNPLLQHVTLVDLPGNGDRNKSRDTMWKKLVGSCSTVWIVTGINRAASEKEPWEILKESCSLMGNGGECRQIHFICTKSDMGRSRNQSDADVRAQILEQNKQAKIDVRAEFNKLKDVKKQFSEECFKVFTVSSTEFWREKRLDPNETEIPKLKEVLQELNDSHSETLNYVSGARGILSLMQGARSTELAHIKKNVRTGLENELSLELRKVKETMEATLTAFEGCLSEGVEQSKSECEELLESVLYPQEDSGSAFHKTLKCVVEKDGIHKPKNGELINVNMKLASCLTDSIYEEFKKTFPNEENRGPFNGVINAFSLGTEDKMMKKEYENVKLQLTFLKTEEEKMKTKLNQIIRERKKTIYWSLAKTIKEKMKPCYDKATQIKGIGTLKTMRETIEEHVSHPKNFMFADAKGAMMEELSDLTLDIQEKLESTMQKSIVLSLETYSVSQSLPDVRKELGKVNKQYNGLIGTTVSPDDDATLRSDSPGQAAAVRP